MENYLFTDIWQMAPIRYDEGHGDRKPGQCRANDGQHQSRDHPNLINN